MKTKVLLLIVLLVGMTCLVVYGRRRGPSYAEQRRAQQQQFEQQQKLLEQQHSRRQARNAERQRRGEGSPQRLAQLEARIAHLEYALTTQLSHAGIPEDLQSTFDAEITRKSKEGKAAVQAEVRRRIVKVIELLSGKKL